MLQLIFRIIALFLLLFLVLSPMYSKYTRHYIVPIKIIEQDLSNITTNFTDNIDTYRCTMNSIINIPSKNSNELQIIHLMSSKCQACIENIDSWRDFPLKLSNDLNEYINGNNKINVQIINLIEDAMLNSNNAKFLIQKIMTTANKNVSDVYDKVQNSNISVCISNIDKQYIDAMKVDILPMTIVLKHNKIIYSVAGQINNTEIAKLSAIVSNYINKNQCLE